MNPRRGRGATPKPGPLVLGSIVYAPIRPDRGVMEPRRSVVFHPPSSDLKQPVWVVGVTSDAGRYDPANTRKYDPLIWIPMPFDPNGSSPTSFTRSCAAKIDTFCQSFDRSLLGDPVGFLPEEDLRRLGNAIKAFLISTMKPK